MTKTWVVENTWTCTSCMSPNKGRYTSCQACGSAKDAEEAAVEVVDPNAMVVDIPLLKQAAEGSHWTCEHCDGKQRAPNGNCTNCGGVKVGDWAEPAGSVKISPPSKEELENYVKKKIEADMAESMKALVEEEATTKRSEALKKLRALPPFPTSLLAVSSLRKPLPLKTIGIVAALSFILLIAWLFWPHEITATVTASRWFQTTRYEARSTLHGDGWGTPFGAFNVACVTRQHGTHNCNPYQCNAHQESYSCRPHSCRCHNVCSNRGNGFSSCHESCSTCYDTCTRTAYSTCYHQCPTYDRWCSYDYYRWNSAGERTANGEGTADMYYPDLGAPNETHRSIYSGSYIVDFQSGEEKFSYAPSSAVEYTKYLQHDRWKCTKAVVGLFKPVERIAQ